jgi:hypothetical protein
MTTVAEKEKKKAAAAQATEYVAASGARVKDRDEARAAPLATTATAELTLHNGSVTFELKVQYNPNSHPHVITGGQITSGICGAPWNITGGFFGDDLRVDAERAGAGSCASTITIVGEYQRPSSYRGTYGFDGATSSFKHTTMYCC